MSIRAICGLAFILLASTVPSFSQNYFLKPVGYIGPGWGGRWTSFVAFSPDGKMVAADAPASPGDSSGNLTLWTFPGGRLVRSVPGRPVALSPDWQYYASDRGVARMDGGDPVLSPKAKGYPLYAFSADNGLVAVAASPHTANDPAIRLVRLTDGKEVGALGFAHPYSLAISPNGKWLAAGYWESVALWDIATHKRIAMLHGFGRYVEGLSFSRDCRYLASGTDWGGVQIWNLHRRTRIHALQIDGADVSEPAFSPNGGLVAVGTYGSGTVWLIDVRSGKVVDSKKVSDLGCGSAAFSPDGRYLITPSTGGLVTWPYDVGGRIHVFRVGAR